MTFAGAPSRARVGSHHGSITKAAGEALTASKVLTGPAPPRCSVCALAVNSPRQKFEEGSFRLEDRKGLEINKSNCDLLLRRFARRESVRGGFLSGSLKFGRELCLVPRLTHPAESPALGRRRLSPFLRTTCADAGLSGAISGLKTQNRDPLWTPAFQSGPRIGLFKLSDSLPAWDAPG